VSDYTDAVARGLQGLLAVSSGTCPGCTTCAETHGVRLLDDEGNDRPSSAIDSEFRALWVSGMADTEPSFSWRPCGICGCCPHCGVDLPDDFVFGFMPEDPTRERHVRRAGYYSRCPACDKLIREDDQFPDEPSRHVCEDESYKASLDSSGDAWFFKSPYFTRAAFCSPCAPGACHLASPCEDGERAYCPGPDWFDDESPAPFPIYSVTTGELEVRS
jgi:hypothetical protein